MENFNRIKNYLLHRMSGEERTQFEADVRHDDVLARELELQRFEMETIDQIEADHLKKKASELRQHSSESQNKNSRSTRTVQMYIYRILAAAASMVLLIGFFFWQQEANKKDITAFSYHQARVVYNATVVNRGNKADAVFEQSYIAVLENRDIDQASEAIDYFLNFQSDSPSAQRRAILNLGHAYLLNQNFLKATATFKDILEMPSATSIQKEEADFFRAVAFVEAGEVDLGRELLEKLAQEGKRYDAVAKKLLNRIK